MDGHARRWSLERAVAAAAIAVGLAAGTYGVASAASGSGSGSGSGWVADSAGSAGAAAVGPAAERRDAAER